MDALKNAILRKTRSGRLAIKARAGALVVGQDYDVLPDYAQHVANHAIYRFHVTSLGQPFTIREELCVVDEDYSYDGLRPVGLTTVTYQYGYGHIIGRSEGAIW